jgi:SAM-dependent methyltransferase
MKARMLFFYDKPRMVNHIDNTAIGVVSRFYGRLIRQGSTVLDLMGSWTSHLPPELKLDQLTVLGMNPVELQANRMAHERVVHDLNLKPRLPFADICFDAVVCTVSVEYLTRPMEVFEEVHRVLKPGGLFIHTFSNRWFPPKVIRIWP